MWYHLFTTNFVEIEFFAVKGWLKYPHICWCPAVSDPLRVSLESERRIGVSQEPSLYILDYKGNEIMKV